MADVDRDLEEIISFCKRFRSEYLDVLNREGQKLKGIAGDITATLRGTSFATSSSAKVEETADKVLKAVSQGEERIREIERKAEQELAELENYR